MASLTKKLEQILEKSRHNPKNKGAQNLKEDQRDSPTRVHPETGNVVTADFGKVGGATVDASGPINASTAPATLKTTPGVSATAGPTGHLPVNSDLPRPQHDGLDVNNQSAGKGKYTLSTEEKDDDEKDMSTEGKLPAFLKKKDDKDGDKDKKKDKEDVKEDKESDKDVEDSKNANDRAGYTAKRKSGGMSEEKKGEAEKFDEEAEKEDKKAVEEATALLMKGESLSEAFKEKTATIFEATLSLRLQEYRKNLTERFTKQLNERVEEIREELSEKVDSHLDLVVENWMNTYHVEIEGGIKAELVEEFIGGLKVLFEEHYIELPAEKVDVVAEMANRIGKLENQLNEQITNNVVLLKRNKLFEKTEIFNKVASGLAATQVEKLRGLAENVEFKGAAEYEKAVRTLKESIDTPAKKGPNPQGKTTLSEQVLEQNPANGTSSQKVTSIIETMARMAKNA